MTERIMFQAAGNMRPLSFGGGDPLLNSKTTAWAGVTLEVHRMASVEGIGESGPLDGECGVLVILNGQMDFVRREGKRQVAEQARPGWVSFLDGHHRASLLRMNGAAEAAALHISNDWFQRLLFEEAPREFGARAPLVHDATVVALTCAIRDEVARGAVTGKLFAESISTALLSYIVERVPLSSMSVRGSLPEEQCRRLRNHILEHLGEDVSLTELAALVGRRPRQFSTLFHQAFGMTPHRYLIAARLAEAARLLTQGRSDISEIALRTGFCSQSHFAEAFRRAYGVTPRTYAAGLRVYSAGTGA